MHVSFFGFYPRVCVTIIIAMTIIDVHRRRGRLITVIRSMFKFISENRLH